MSQLYISVKIYFFLHIEEGLELVNLLICCRSLFVSTMKMILSYV